MGNKAGGASKTNQASSYKTNKTWEKNRIRKLKKLLVKQPNNQQIVNALANVRYRRATPKARFWSSTRKNTAKLFKLFTGKVHMEIFNNNEKVSLPALLLPGPYSSVRSESVSEKTMFTLGARARWKE